MKSTFLIVPFVILLFACNEVTDSNKDKILLASKYEIVCRMCLDSNCNNIFDGPIDSISRYYPPRGKLTYAPGFKLYDEIIYYTLAPNNDTVYIYYVKINTDYVDSTVFYSGIWRMAFAHPVYYSFVNINRNGILLWSGKDTVYMK